MIVPRIITFIRVYANFKLWRYKPRSSLSPRAFVYFSLKRRTPEYTNLVPAISDIPSQTPIPILRIPQMDFNSARMSQQFRSQSQPNGGRGKQQQNDSDALLRLVRLNCLNDPTSAANCSFLSRPIEKSQDVSVISAYNSHKRTCRSPTRNRFRRSSNGLRNCS